MSRGVLLCVLTAVLSMFPAAGDSYSPGAAGPLEEAPDLLTEAIRLGDVDQAAQLVLFSEVSIHDRDADGRTALHHAAAAGSQDIVRILLLHGADPFLADDHGYLPIHLAYPGSPETAALLSDSGTLCFMPGPDGMSPADLAVISGWDSVSLMTTLLSPHISGESGETLLHRAARLGRPEIVERLLDQQLSVYRRDSSGRLALDAALQEYTPGHLAAAAALIASGSPSPNDVRYRYLYDALQEGRLNQRDDTGRTALHHAAASGHQDIARFLLQRQADPALADPAGRTPLHQAVLSGMKELLEPLADRGADIHAPDITGRTPLHTALREQACESLISALLALGSDVQSADFHGETILHAAAVFANAEITAALIASGAEVSRTDHSGSTPLLRALEADRTDTAAVLLEQGSSLFASGEAALILHHRELIELLGDLHRIEETDVHGSTLLHSAAISAAPPEIITVLLEQGIALEAKNSRGSTALHEAAEAGSWDALALLLTHGADPFTRTPDGKTPMEYILGAPRDRMKQLFTEELLHTSGPHGTTPLMIAASKQLTEGVSLLLELGVDILAPDASGRTALHIAAELDAVPVMLQLIRESQRLDIRDHGGLTPLHQAVISGSRRTARLLLLAGASPTSRSGDGHALVHTAVLSGDAQMIRTLLEFRSPLESTDSHGRTPLLLAASRSLEQEALLLIELGADIQARDSQGSTPLHLGILHRMDQLIQVLIDKGADIHSKDRSGLSPYLLSLKQGTGTAALLTAGDAIHERDNEGNTPLHLAVRQQAHPEVISVLLSQGSEVNSRNNQLLTPLHYALAIPSRKAATMLIEAGADLFLPDGDQVTPIDMLLSMPEQALAWPPEQVLLESRDHEGKTALHYAVIRGNGPAAAYLIDLGADVRREDDFGSTPDMLTEEQHILELLR